MSEYTNAQGQRVGFAVPDWKGARTPSKTPIQGRYCRLEPLDALRHAADLYAAYVQDVPQRNWTYLAYGPFDSFEAYRAWLEGQCLGVDPLFYAISEAKTGRAVGVASYLRIDPKNGSIEVGHIHYSPLLQKTPAATEAMYWMMRQAFEDLGYRRYEWKCDDLNAPSHQAAQRLGFVFEGVFRQATVYKGRNRDTAWYSVIDAEWPRLKAAFEEWLHPSNFDENGMQRQSLQARTSPKPA